MNGKYVFLNALKCFKIYYSLSSKQESTTYELFMDILDIERLQRRADKYTLQDDF